MTDQSPTPLTNTPQTSEDGDSSRAFEGGTAPRRPVTRPSRIHVTEAALEAIREMLDEDDLPEDGGLRLSARTGAGCSAPLQYGMVLEAAPEADDRILEGRGVRIFMDPESAWILDGLVVDYVTDSPMGEGFAFRHPRGPAGRSC